MKSDEESSQNRSRKRLGSTSAWIFSTETIFLINFERILKWAWLLFVPLFLLNTPPLLCFFVFPFRNVTELFMDYVTTPIFLLECCETLRIMQQGSFWLPECCGTLRIAQQCFFLTSGMSRNFTDYLTMGVKYLEAVKQRLHATKQWSLDKIRDDSCPSLLIFYLR